MKYTKSRFLMGTDINITIISSSNPLQDIYDSFAIFYSLEKEFSRFLDDSDLSLLNFCKEMELSNRFINILKLTLEVYNKTNHYFNPLISLKNIGYSKDFGKGVFEKVEQEVDSNFDKISIIGNFVILKQNQNLDLGGIVKGYSVDLVVNFLKSKGYINFIINAGGDIYLSGNNFSGKIPIVLIDNPFNTNEILATLELKDKSISTSGTYKRKWSFAEQDYHHIINPETNLNNNEIISITLISDNCYISDSYATACIAMGIKKSLYFLEEQNIDGLIIGSDGNIYQTKNMVNYKLNIR